MQEENSFNEPNSEEWQAPPPPEKIPEAEPAQKSEPATLGSIFFEPGETFEDLRRKPRFVLAGLLIIVAFSVFNFLFIQKVGFEKIIRARLETSSRVQQMPEADKQKMIEQQSSPLVKGISYAAVPIVMAVVFLIGGLIYWLASNAMGASINFSHGIAIWVYSMFPPAIIGIIANIIVLFLKSVDDIDILTSQNGLIKANPSFLINARAMPVLATFLSSIDLFAIWGWVLAAIGLQRIARLSAGSAWAIVIILGLIGVAIKVVLALVFG
jgi:hypothetical protein